MNGLDSWKLTCHKFTFTLNVAFSWAKIWDKRSLNKNSEAEFHLQKSQSKNKNASLRYKSAFCELMIGAQTKATLHNNEKCVYMFSFQSRTPCRMVAMVTMLSNWTLRGPSKHYSYTLEVPVDYLVDSCFSIRIYFINKSRVDYSALLVYLPEFYPKQNIDTQTIGILRPAIDLPSHLFWGIYSSNFGRCSHIQTTKTNNRGQYMAPTQTKHYCRLLWSLQNSRCLEKVPNRFTQMDQMVVKKGDFQC